MGVFSDSISGDVISTNAPGIHNSIRRQLESLSISVLGDPDISDDTAVIDEVQSIAQHVEADAGDFTITVTLANGESFETAAIAYDANAAAIELAIDTAADGTVTGWFNGDISVAGFDDNTYACSAAPFLTTMRHDIREVGRRAAEVLLDRISGQLAVGTNVSVTADLLIRETTAPPRDPNS